MGALEFTALLRDIAIIVFIAFSSLLMAVLLLPAVLLYRRVTSIVNSAQRITKNLEEGTSNLQDHLFKPLIKGGGLAFGAVQALRFLLGLRGKRGGKGNG